MNRDIVVSRRHIAAKCAGERVVASVLFALLFSSLLLPAAARTSLSSLGAAPRRARLAPHLSTLATLPSLTHTPYATTGR